MPSPLKKRDNGPMRTQLLIAFCLLASPALAQDKTAAPQEIGKYGAWTVYRLNNAGALSCYAVTQPAKSDPPAARRDPAYLFLTHRPKEKVRSEFSVNMGYPLKPNSAGSLDILGAGKFTLVTNGEGAYLADGKQDAAAAAALRKGREAVVKATSKRGTATSDRYSLNGVAQALDRIDQECPKQ